MVYTKKVWVDGTPAAPGTAILAADLNRYEQNFVDSAASFAHAVSPRGSANDGQTDDTATVQAAVDICPPGGIVDGLGLIYVVTSVNLKSDLEFRNFNFITKAGAVNFVSPVTIGAYYDTTLRENITLRNVHVNGNRVNQTGISGGEDGGRHGFRFIGRIENLVMEDCSATMCASDGWSYFHGLGMSTVLQYDTGLLKNAYINRCQFNSNRRHGMSLDSCDGVWFTDISANDNGVDVPGGTEGAGGATYLGNRYGNGMDVEEYSNTTWAGNIHFTRAEMLRNERAGMLCLQATASKADDPLWVPRKGYTFTDCHFDSGVGSTATGYALQITPMDANVALGWYYDDVSIRDCTLGGKVLIQAVKNARHEGGSVVTPDPVIGLAKYVESFKVTASRSGKAYTATNTTVRYSPDDPESIWLGAASLALVGSAPVLNASVGFIPTWVFRDANNDRIGATFRIPSDWKSANIDLLWCNTDIATGSVVWRCDIGSINDGLTLAAAPSGAMANPVAGGQFVSVLSRVRTNATVTPGLANVALVRLGADTNDSLVSGVAVLGLRITRVA